MVGKFREILSYHRLGKSLETCDLQLTVDLVFDFFLCLAAAIPLSIAKLFVSLKLLFHVYLFYSFTLLILAFF